MADQPLLVGQPQPPCGCTRGDDERACFDPLTFNVEAERPFGKVGFDHPAVLVVSAEILRLFTDIFHQSGAVNAFRETWKILDQGCQR